MNVVFTRVIEELNHKLALFIKERFRVLSILIRISRLGNDLHYFIIIAQI